jgi:TetR/AcrR family transcriptional repressor of nem operon
MARTIEFDPDTARNKALVLFWRKGYQASSLTDLLQAMEISRSSFYAAFVDKRSLFIECLDLFAGRTQALVARARDGMPPLDALQHFFVRSFTSARGSKTQWGCMLINTVLEMAGVDDELSARASTHLDGLQAAFESCLVDAGCAPERVKELADLLSLLNEGVRVSSRRKLSPERQMAAIATTFRMIRSEIA